MSKKEEREKREREAAAQKAKEEWEAKVAAEKALIEARKAATAAGPDALAEFEAQLMAEAQRRRYGRRFRLEHRLTPAR